MKKAKRVLALVLAFIMIASVFTTTVFARTDAGDYEAYRTSPKAHSNGVDKLYFSTEEGAQYILDLLDDLLTDANIYMVDYQVLDEWYGDAYLTIYLRNIDEALWTIYNAVNAVANGDSTCIGNIIQFDLFGGITVGDSVLSTAVKALDLGDIEDLDISHLTDQNSNSRTCRNYPVKSGVSASSDIAVLKMLTQFLADNASILAKIPMTGDDGIDFGLLDSTIKGIDGVGDYLSDLPTALKNLLYSKLWDSSVESAPDGWTYETGLNTLVDWLLVSGTGDDAETGGNSILGAEFDAFLPDIANYDGGASVTDQSTYSLVYNAIEALLSGTVSDLLEGLLIDLLDIDTSTDPRGDQSVMSNMIYNIVVGAIKDLCEGNGAPELVFEGDEANYPIPQIEKLLNWFFVGGGLSTFISITREGISLTDNFISLLNDVLRLLPTLMPLLGIEVPDSIAYSSDELSATVTDEVRGDIYLTFEEEEIYIKDPETDIVYVEGSTTAVDTTKTTFTYVANDNTVNTTNSSASDYRNPTFIRQEYQVSVDQVWAYILKIILNSVIDGAYFPEWADSISSVGAYGLASLAAQYMPENNYFDRLDKYHWVHDLGNTSDTYQPRGGVQNSQITALPYTETVTCKVNGQDKEVQVPRAAADIGASIGAYFLAGEFDFFTALGFYPETDTNFETFVFEFLYWGLKEYMPLLCGEYDGATKQFTTYEGTSTKGTWTDEVNVAIATFNSLHDGTYAPVTRGTGLVNQIPSSAISDTLFNLIDNTLLALLPSSLLPDSIASNNSQPAKTAVYWWIGDSLVNFDLQQFFSILTVNTSSDAELQQPVLTIIVRLIDKVLGLLLGGNAVLPDITVNSAHRNVFDNTTSLTNLTGLLGSSSALSSLISNLFTYLNTYIEPLADTVFPILATYLVSGQVKSATYKPSTTASAVNYLGSNTQITYDQLKEYYDEYKTTLNTEVFSGKVYYTTEEKAKDVAGDIGLSNYTPATETVNGSIKYVVEFPESYSLLSCANFASEYIAKYTDKETEVNTKRNNGSLTYTVSTKLDYLENTATETANGTDKDGDGINEETQYVYSNFHRAEIITNNGSTRTGTYGEVQYEDGYRTFEREDFPAYQTKYYSRLNDALNDASDYLDDFDTYAKETLPSAYGEWLMYFVNAALKDASLYDGNDDGTIDSNDTDSYPEMPSKTTPYPFTATSGSVQTTGLKTAVTYNFSTVSNSLVVAAALENAQDSENDVTLNNVETQAVVRLALEAITFDITPDSDGNYVSGSIQWDDLTSDQLATITTKCNSLGLTFTTDEDGNYIIKRPAFAMFSANFNHTNTIYTAYAYTYTNPSGGQSSSATAAVNYTPATYSNAAATCELTNNIAKSYIKFAETAMDYNEKLNDYYDNISYRAEICEDQICQSPTLNTLKFFIDYCEDAYYPINATEGINKTYDSKTGLLVPMYSASTFEPFQKAYDYATCLRDYIENGGNITQSLVTEAYKALYKAYQNLELYGAMADWTKLVELMDRADEILDGPLGLNDDGTVKDATYGYTLETLQNLETALAVARTMYNNNAATWDTTMQDEVSEEGIVLEAVINALAFHTELGIIPNIIVKSDYTGDATLENYTTDYTSTEADNSYILGVILGLEEGVGITEQLKETAFTNTGFTVNGTTETFELTASSYGSGTGSFLTGTKNFSERVRYTAVVFGDLNGDARIDGNDKTILAMYDATDTIDSMEKYYSIAADVDFDGDIDEADIQKIKAHYTYREYSGIDGTINQNGTVSENWVN